MDSLSLCRMYLVLPNPDPRNIIRIQPQPCVGRDACVAGRGAGRADCRDVQGPRCRIYDRIAGNQTIEPDLWPKSRI